MYCWHLGLSSYPFRSLFSTSEEGHPTRGSMGFNIPWLSTFDVVLIELAWPKPHPIWSIEVFSIGWLLLLRFPRLLSASRILLIGLRRACLYQKFPIHQYTIPNLLDVIGMEVFVYRPRKRLSFEAWLKLMVLGKRKKLILKDSYGEVQ